MPLEQDMTKGKISKLIYTFSIPILLGNVFQQLYSIVDAVVIGHALGSDSLAAIGTAGSIFNMLIGFASSMTTGFCLGISRYYGGKEKEKLHKVVNASILLTMIIAILFGIFSMIGLKSVLKLLNTPDSIREETLDYLKIMLLFSVVTLVYNLFSSMLRAIGNSRTPLHYLMISTTVNMVLDILFIQYFKMCVKGAAYASVIAQSLSVILCIITIQKHFPLLQLDRSIFRQENEVVIQTALEGISMGFVVFIVQIGSAVLLSGVNMLGTKCITAYTVARRLEDFLMIPINTISLVAGTFASQNFGAGKIERLKEGVISMLKICGISIVVEVLFVFFLGERGVILIAGTTDDQIIKLAVQYLKINVLCFSFLGILLLTRCSLLGIGKKLISVSTSFIELVIKILGTKFLIDRIGYLGICLIEPIAWEICMIVVCVSFVRVLYKINERKE